MSHWDYYGDEPLVDLKKEASQDPRRRSAPTSKQLSTTGKLVKSDFDSFSKYVRDTRAQDGLDEYRPTQGRSVDREGGHSRATALGYSMHGRISGSELEPYRAFGRGFKNMHLDDEEDDPLAVRSYRGRGGGRSRGGGQGRGGGFHRERDHIGWGGSRQKWGGMWEDSGGGEEGGRGARRGRGRSGRGAQSRGGIHPRPKGGIKFLTQEEIEELANGYTENVIQAISDNEAGFKCAFSHDKNYTNPRVLKRLIKILYSLVTGQEGDLAARILAEIFSPSGKCLPFCTQIGSLLQKMPFEVQAFIKVENNTCLLHLVHIGLFGIETVPRNMLQTFPKLNLIDTVEQLRHEGENIEIVHTKCQALEEKFRLAQKELYRPRPCAKKLNLRIADDDLEPPEHFTLIAVLPQNNDMKSGADFKPFLRSNIVEGKYRDWDHYLDVQFRLLREDFIAPLRDGIQNHYMGMTKRNTDIRLYHDVRILFPVCLFTGIGFEITFTADNHSRIRWEHSRRLIFGSLLCLSNDDFQSFIFATVVNSDPKKLADGYLTIKFEGGTSGFHIDPTDAYVMVESTAYFEAYRHILLGLQSASELQYTMPFKQYIVDCDMENIRSPLYIRNAGSICCFDLTDALGTKRRSIVEISTKPYGFTWPDVCMTKLDKNQYEAIKMALQKEISVIQGPPGTGKTYIGLKLAQAFLENRAVWDPSKNSPILVVCYTNHALDQFLEGIYDHCCVKGIPPKITRIGGRCKSEKLANFVLSVKVKEAHAEKSIPFHIHKENKEARDDMKTLQTRIENSAYGMSDDNIVSARALRSLISDVHYLQLTQDLPTEPRKEIEVWLNLWYLSEGNDEVAPTEYENVELVYPKKGSNKVQDDKYSDDEFIAVDEEATILRDERMLEGEEIELPAIQSRTRKQQGKKQQKLIKDQSEWEIVQMSDRDRKKKIKQGFRNKPMPEKKAKAVQNIWQLNQQQRWELYHYWASLYLKQRKLEVEHRAHAYNLACKSYSSTRLDIDCFVARGADVIGMTTTGAAKFHHLLQAIHPKIVIIEEAAEVFESHIITSLSPSVQQLILIGDHKQLRPKPNSYTLEKKYNLGISLFERLVRNAIPHVTLRVQHRMRPKIASLICPAIYNELKNADSVKEYKCVAGVGHNLFFIDHRFPEEKANPEQALSHMNIHEAEYMVALCRYFLNQGYAPDQITLLTMYRGQLLKMKGIMKRKEFEGVRVAAVDDFQGEENDIILLSLVRSNSDGKIGFLEIENRICVSLSRAKEGFYVIGNFEMLRPREDTKWPQILSVVDKLKCIGEALPLHCQIHTEEKIQAKLPSDFSKSPEGGCLKPCNARLNCGHKCTRLCHPTDIEHKLFKCQKTCRKVLPCGHICKNTCFNCREKCGPCCEYVEKIIPLCQHTVKLQCHQDPNKTPCTRQCTKTLPCGHLCQGLCSQTCTSKCLVRVTKTLPCGHIATVPCYMKPEKVECHVKCEQLLKCDHKCKGTCSICYQGRLHTQCQARCNRALVCGHICTFPCIAECPPCQLKCKNYCTHSKCQNKCYKPCTPCAEPCQWRCEHLRCTRKCGQECNRPPCDEPCPKYLCCGHPCIGLCGEKCPKLCRVCNKVKVTEVFFGMEDEEDARFVQLEDCKHIFEYTGLDRWMKDSDDDGPSEIKLKECPRCKTLIRRSLRYSNQIKRVHNNFEEIKKIQLSTTHNNLVSKLSDTVEKVRNCEPVKASLLSIIKIISDPAPLFPHHLNAIENQLNMLPAIASVHTTLANLAVRCKVCRFGNCVVSIEVLQQDAKCLQGFITQNSLFDQQLDDIKSEIGRLESMSRMCDLYFKLIVNKSKPSPRDKADLYALAEHVYCSGAGGITKHSDDTTQQVTQLIARFNKQYKVGGLTEAERTEIVKAIGLSKGHWFKCPNGHFYCIGDCGGAMVEAKCPDCDAKIGGTRHTLLDTNRLAPEMDGAQYAAWSEGANMGNYDL